MRSDPTAPLDLDGGTFQRLTAACDSLLRAPGNPPGVLASPALHVVSNHPVQLGQQRPLIEPTGRRIAAGARHLRNLARRKREVELDPLDERQVILVGGLVDDNHLERGEDFYFGTLASRLAARGVSSLHLVRNQTPRSWRSLAPRAHRDGTAARRLLPDALGFGVERDLIREGRRARAHVLERAGRTEESFDTRLWRRAAATMCTPSATGNLRIEALIGSMCRTLRPAAVVVMYEGHAWERCAWRGAYLADPEILKVGYQHTIIRKHAHAMRRALGPAMDPDVVLCLGDASKAALAASEIREARFLTYGTHRTEGAVRPPPPDAGRRPCLVLPEGLQSEAILLFGCALEVARRDPGVRFVFRSHPVLPYSRLVAATPALGQLPPNVELSEETSLSDDVARCGTLLYRGSSTILYGILGGLKPFYLRRSAELTVDPVHTLTAWREVVDTPEELTAGLNAVRSAPADQADWRLARDHCLGLTGPERDEAVDELVAMIEGNARVRH